MLSFRDLSPVTAPILEQLKMRPVKQFRLSISIDSDSSISAHINHIRNIAGIDSVGIGADYDGISE